MKFSSVLFTLALTAAPLSAGLLDAPERLPPGTDSVIAFDISGGAIPRAAGLVSFSAKASESVFTQQLYGFAAETGIDLNAPMSFVLAGPHAHPERTLLTGTLKVDPVKLAAALRALPALKMDLKEIPGGLLITDPRTGVLFKDGRFVMGARAPVEAQATGSEPAAAPEPAPPASASPAAGTAPAADPKVVAADLAARAGANATCALLMRLPNGLPGNPPPPSAVFGQQLGGFWIRFRALFMAIREQDFALELAFDSPEAAQAALPVVNGWLDVLAGQLGAAEANAKAAAAESGPFKHLNSKWVSARLARESYLQMRANVAIKVEGADLSFTMPRENLQGSSAIVTTAIVGILAAIAVPQFVKYRNMAAAARPGSKPSAEPSSSPVDSAIKSIFGK